MYVLLIFLFALCAFFIVGNLLSRFWPRREDYSDVLDSYSDSDDDSGSDTDSDESSFDSDVGGGGDYGGGRSDS